MKSLEGKTALVTGASRNLGRGVAERLAREGALVALNYAANDAAANETLAAIMAAGGQAFLVKQELGTSEAAAALADKVTTELRARTGSPDLDILINNVGGGEYGTIALATPELFETTVSNNLRAPFFLTQALLPNLRDNGRVVNLSSAASRLALSEVIVYSMCKAAVDVFTVALARELGPRGITVNAIAPGFNETESNADAANDPATRQQIEAATTLGRFGTVSDIADAVYSLVSPDMGWVTGQIVEASGGFRL